MISSTVSEYGYDHKGQVIFSFTSSTACHDAKTRIALQLWCEQLRIQTSATRRELLNNHNQVQIQQEIKLGIKIYLMAI